MEKFWLDKRRTLRSVTMFSAGKAIYPICVVSMSNRGSHPASHSPIIGIFSPGVKWSGRESDETPPSSTKAKNDWNYGNPAPSHVLS